VTLLAEGIAALSAGNLPTAEARLSEAYRLWPRPEVLYQLGRLALLSGRTLQAQDLFRRYLADPTRPTDEAATQFAEKQLTQPSKDAGSVSVLSEPGALVSVDGRVIGSLPLPLPLSLSPGSHTVALEFADKRLEAPVQVQIGRITELRMSRASGTVLVSVLPAFWY
jgi:hypothetical protein